MTIIIQLLKLEEKKRELIISAVQYFREKKVIKLLKYVNTEESFIFFLHDSQFSNGKLLPEMF